MRDQDAYDEVPDVDRDAQVDPHWAELMAGGASTLPRSYLPPAMPASLGGWRKAAAWTVISMLVSVTSAGVCLTYGPNDLFAFLAR